MSPDLLCYRQWGMLSKLNLERTSPVTLCCCRHLWKGRSASSQQPIWMAKQTSRLHLDQSIALINIAQVRSPADCTSGKEGTELAKSLFWVECEHPKPHLYTFNGRLCFVSQGQIFFYFANQTSLFITSSGAASTSETPRLFWRHR